MIARPGLKIDWGSVKQFDEGEFVSLIWNTQKPADQAAVVTVTFTDNPAGDADVLLQQLNREASGGAAAELGDGYSQVWVGVFEVCFV